MKKKYFLIQVALMLFFTTVNAQIIYTDISPDVTTTLNETEGFKTNIVSIDFDGNGTEEYNFRWDDFSFDPSFPEWFMHMTFLTGNEFNLKVGSTNDIEPMTLDTPISDVLNWGFSNPEPFIAMSERTNFQNLGDRYVGCKFKLGSNIHYGWVRVSFSSDKTLTVKDYAYESTPNKLINAGKRSETLSTSVINYEKIISIYPNPANNFITIKSRFQTNNSKVIIYDLSGKLIVEYILSNNVNDIDISKLETGIYIVNIFDEYNKKIGQQNLIVK